MITAEDISEELGISRGKAYNIVKTLNEELGGMGYVVIAGKLPRAYWETKFFCGNENLCKNEV